MPKQLCFVVGPIGDDDTEERSGESMSVVNDES